MQLAHQARRDSNIVTMRALLDGANPWLRGWEWRYRDRLSDGSLQTVKWPMPRQHEQPSPCHFSFDTASQEEHNPSIPIPHPLSLGAA